MALRTDANLAQQIDSYADKAEAYYKGKMRGFLWGCGVMFVVLWITANYIRYWF